LKESKGVLTKDFKGNRTHALRDRSKSSKFSRKNRVQKSARELSSLSPAKHKQPERGREKGFSHSLAEAVETVECERGIGREEALHRHREAHEAIHFWMGRFNCGSLRSHQTTSRRDSIESVNKRESTREKNPSWSKLV